MNRRKSAAPKRINHSDVNNSSCSSSKRRKSGLVKLRRRILCKVDDHVPVMGPLRLALNATLDSEVPTIIEIGEEMQVTVSGHPVTVPLTTAELLCKSKGYAFIHNSSSANELILDVALTALPLANARNLVETLCSKDYSNFAREEVVDKAWSLFFYELEELQRSRSPPNVNLQHVDLQPTLRGYQAAAVAWMMDRESIPSQLELDWLPDVADIIETRNGVELLYNKYSESLYTKIASSGICSGGILADEMGLGKTVITLALILNHKRLKLETWEKGENCEKSCGDESSMTCESDDDVGPSAREQNNESNWDANEQLQLVRCKSGRGILKTKLAAWYESKLAEVSVKKSKKRTYRPSSFKCSCGDEVEKALVKTVKCSCCLLFQHKTCGGYQSKHPYICASCWRHQTPVPSGATLIIAPPAIFSQWASEIERHTPSLKTLLYSGVRENFVQPTHLADFDVVVTTYSVLRAETLYAMEPAERRLRNEGRFLRVSSPLERVGWWRIVCDEAQMVESDVSLVRTMTQRLSSVHRWCVTGTPIQRGVADLFYLTSFMGLGVLDDKKVWMDFLLQPYLAGCKKPLLSVLNQVFWRSTKEEVSCELALPEQTFNRHKLKFSAIEETFYMQQHALSASKFAEGIYKSGLDANLTLDNIDKGKLNRLLQPLLNLRQACTHAQVVSGISINSASGAANLKELLQYLVKKTKQECEESLRRHVAALNGLAGLHCLTFEWLEAIEIYRAVLRLAEECCDDVHVDTLQRIHAMTNAAYALQQCSGVAPPTLRDDRLLDDAAQLEQKYLSKPAEAFKSSLQQAEVSSKEVKAIREEFHSSPDSWWVPVTLALKDIESELLDKLAEELHSNDPTEKNSSKYFLSKLTTLRSVEVTIRQWWTSLEKYHKTVLETMKTLAETPSKELVEQALSCHLRTTEQRRLCDLCRVENTLWDLECELFATTRKSIKQREKVIDGALTKGSWKPHSAERTLTTVLALARSRCNLESWCLQDGKQHTRLLDSMKKEFKHLRAAWTALNHRVHAEDELTMAKLRLRLAEPWEARHRPCILALSAPDKMQTVHLVPPSEIPAMKNELTSERDTALSNFRKKQGRLLYLQNLGKDRNAAPEPCPVCKNPLYQQWCVLTCGHCFCIDCLQMIHGGSTRRIKCPVCREFTDAPEVGFVDIGGRAEKLSDIEVIGDFSTKVDSIVREVLRLLNQEPAIKILIFSTWSEVLKILSQAFATNKVNFVQLPSNKHQVVLQTFRDANSGVSVLLLPYSWGSKGLNLVEATHVFLVEPILNSADELQAIGRVHRIGQTKPTTVHRFIVKGTVEEKIFEAVSEAKDSWSNKTITLADLQKLFIIPSRQTS